MPTPVGPRKTNEPIGRFGSCKPERARRSAFETASIAGVLADDALVQPLLHVDELLHLALEQPVDGDLRPGGDDGGDVVLVDLLLHHRLDGADGLAALGQLLLERRQEAVADLRHALEVAVALGPLGLHPQLVDLAGDLLDAVEHVLLAGPARRELVATRLGLGDLALDRLAHGRRLLRHRGELDLELRHAPLGLVELDRRAVDLHPQPRGRLVDEVDRLVRQEAVGDVALGEDGGGRQRGIADADAVVRLVALLQAAQDRDRVGDGRLADEHRLEAPLERRRPSRCACGTRRASSRRRRAARRARASA